MNKFTFITILFALLLIAAAFFFKGPTNPPPNTPSVAVENPQDSPQTEIIANNLEVPWALAFLPNGKLLVTERAGKVSEIDGGKVSIAQINVKQTGESGLHGIAVDPDFEKNNFIYLYYTYSAEEDNSLNRVSRFTFQDNQLKDEKILVGKIPGATIHDGGRIKFGPDNLLYITTGDAANPSLAQDKNSLAGKILRVKDGKAEVYSYGHRNPQGITWDNQGRIWEVEHGQSATDELNLIEEGQNYGWPTIRGDQTQAGMKNPVIHSGSDTWAPGDIAFFAGKLYFAGLRGQALFEYNIESRQLTEHFKGKLGRIREVILSPDNMLYITTSNRDGRGSPNSGDDKIIKINPQKL